MCFALWPKVSNSLCTILLHSHWLMLEKKHCTASLLKAMFRLCFSGLYLQLSKKEYCFWLVIVGFLVNGYSWVFGEMLIFIFVLNLTCWTWICLRNVDTNELNVDKLCFCPDVTETVDWAKIQLYVYLSTFWSSVIPNEWFSELRDTIKTEDYFIPQSVVYVDIDDSIIQCTCVLIAQR